MTKPIRAYKAFHADLTCRDFQYEIGKSYKMKGKPVLCERGFHACNDIDGLFYFYPVSADTRICEVELSGTIRERHILSGSYKLVANNIKIIRELTKKEIEKVALTPDENGHYPDSVLTYYLVKYPYAKVPDNILLSLQGYCQELLVVSSSLPIRKQLTNSYYWKIRHRLASLNQPALLDILVTDPDERVRCMVAQVGRKRHRDQLATDSAPEVRKVVVSFGSTHQKETILRTEQDRGVLYMIREKGSKRQQKIAIQKLNGVFR